MSGEQVHCWRSAKRRAASRQCIEIYYTIEGREVLVDMVDIDINAYPEDTDKVYLGVGTFYSSNAHRHIKGGLSVRPEVNSLKLTKSELKQLK